MKFKLPALFHKKSAGERLADKEADKAPPPAPKAPAIDFKQILVDFQTLDPKDPGLWPLAPRIVILLGIFSALIAASWGFGNFGWSVQIEEWEKKQAEESKLREDWTGKKRQAVNLDGYKQQKVEIERLFGELLKQLPNQSEMGDLLVDINKAAQSRGLLVNLFRPGGEATKDFYAEKPIDLDLVGSYHELGAFAGDIADMPRIVTLNDINLTVDQRGVMTMKTKAKTFRYLDEGEKAKLRKPAGAKK